MADSTLKPASPSKMDATVNNNNNSKPNPNPNPAATAAVDNTDANDASAPGDAEDGADAGAPAQRGRKRRLMGVDPSLIISDGRSKRRKSPTPDPASSAAAVKSEAERDPKDRVRAQTLGREIYQKIMDSAKEGESMSEPFIKLPSKKLFPDYYEMIKHPMCLDTVRSKLDKQEYETLKEVTTDLGQIFTNAKRYNLKDSELFQWAKKLHKMTRTFYSKLTESDANQPDSEDEGAPNGPSSGPSKPRRSDSFIKGEPMVPSGSADMDDEDVDMGGPSNTSVDGESQGQGQARYGGRTGKKRGSYMKDGPTVYKLVKPILKAIRDARSTDGMDREITAIFETLPDRKDLPDYYSAIKNPISLSEIANRVDARRYETWEEFFEQVDLMCANAMQYNEDDSDVFRDAQQIKALLDTHRSDIQKRLSLPSNQKSRARPSASRPDAHQPVPRDLVAPYPGYDGTSPHHSSGLLPSASPAPQRSHLVPLPAGVVSDEIVARLYQYPAQDQQAWASSLAPAAMSQYRQILIKLEARRRTLAGQAPVPLAEPASAARPGTGGPANGNGTSTPAQPFNLAYRTKPPQPMVKHLDFAFNAPVPASEGGGKERHTIRLYNLRGVVTHSLIIGAETAEVEITAMLATLPEAGEGAAAAAAPEVRLRVNGNPGSTAKQIYAETEETAAEGSEVEGGATAKGKPIGMRWTVPIAHTRMETRLDVVCVLAGKTEQCGIYISRQF